MASAAGVMMTKRGRPRKAGRRTDKGRLERNNYPVPIYDRGSEWVQAMRLKYGEHYGWAMGRAYAAGLLGEGNDAKNRLDAAKRFVRLYQRFIGGVAYTCPLDDSVRGGNVVHLDVPDHQKDDHQWLFAAMDAMDVSGCRPYFDQLISSLFIDSGPYWLDNILAVRVDMERKKPDSFRVRFAASPDQAILNAAIRALDIIAPEQRSPIRALTWD